MVEYHTQIIIFAYRLYLTMRRTLVTILVLTLFLLALSVNGSEPYRVSGKVTDGLPDMSVRKIEQDSIGYLWFTTLGGTARYDGYQLQTFPTDSSTTPLPSLKDNLGNIWQSDLQGTLTRSDGLAIHVMSADDIKNVGKERFAIYDDGRGSIWISTYGAGIVCYDTSTRTLQHFNTSQPEARRLPTDFILCLAGDRDHNVWAGTEHAGAVRLSPTPSWATLLVPQPIDKFDRTNSIKLLKRVGGEEVWIGNRKGDVYVYTPALEGPIRTWQFPAIVFGVCHNAAGQLLAGTRGQGVMRLSPTGPLPWCTTSEVTNVFGMTVDRRGTLWLALFENGLGTIASGSREVRPCLPTKRMTARAVTTDRNGQIWAATSQGALLIDPDRYAANDSTAMTFLGPQADTRALFADSRGRIWMSLPGQGVIVFTPSADYREIPSEVYTNEFLRNDNPVQSIIEDVDGYIWMGTEKGLLRLHPTTREVDNLTIGGGRTDIFIENSACALADGRLLLGTDHGVIVITPGNTPKSISPQPVTTSLNQDHAGNVTVQLSALSYRSDVIPLYSCLLEGYDKSWSDPTDNPTIVYTGLRPGKYRLKARARLFGNDWSQETVVAEFQVPSQVLQEWGLYIPLFLLIGWIVWDIVQHWYLRRKQERANIPPPEATSPDPDALFIDRIHKIIAANIANADFTIDDFAQAAAISRTGLYNRVKSLMQTTPMDLLRRARMEQAAALLAKRTYTVGEVAALCGIKDPLYFSRCFKERYGVSPSHYAEKDNMD